jgi:hypothetical protein
MIRRNVVLNALLFLLSLGTCEPLFAAWKAGAAKTNITPEKLMWMSGYGARDHAAEVGEGARD